MQTAASGLANVLLWTWVLSCAAMSFYGMAVGSARVIDLALGFLR